MIIVGQNKGVIYNFNNVNCIMTRNVEEKCKIMLFDNTYSAEMIDGDCIGIYETEKRAKEILGEIVDTYKFNSCYAVGQKQAVYKMPKE